MLAYRGVRVGGGGELFAGAGLAAPQLSLGLQLRGIEAEVQFCGHIHYAHEYMHATQHE